MRKAIRVVLVVLLAASGAIGQDDDTAKTETDGRIAGQCHCGYIKYEAQGPAVKSSYCNCRGCQRATGTLKVPFVSVRRAGFRITAGKPAEFRAKSGVKCDAGGVWYFCPKCGTQVHWKADQGEEIDIFAGTLHDTRLFQPKR